MLRRRRYLRRIAFATLALGAVAAGLIVFWEKLPYQSVATRQIRQVLASYGLVVTSLEVEALTHQQARLSDITLGESHSLHAGEVTASYSLQEARRGKLRSLALSDLALNFYQTPQGWQVGGLEPLLQTQGSPASTGDAALPFNPEALRALLPDAVTISSAKLTAEGKDGNAKATFHGQLTNADTLRWELNAGGLSAEAGSYRIKAEALHLDGALDAQKKHWRGAIISPALHITGLSQDVPPLALKGTFSLDSKKIALSLHLKDKTGQTKLDFSLSLPLDTPEKAALLLRHAQFPWGDGIISTKDVKIALAGGQPIRIALQLEHVQLPVLLAAVSKGKVQGTGVISGTLPLTYFPDGRIALHAGGMQAEGKGQLSVAPDALPAGENENLETVRTALKDFYYETLKITVVSDADDAPTIQLAVEGKSPDAFGGRPIKLNVNLTGDILPLVQQSVLPVNDVRKLLKLQDTP